MSLHSTAAKSTGQCSKPCCSATVACAGDQSFEVPRCRTSTPGDSAHKIPMSLERCAAVPGQPGGNGAASQRDLLAMACTAILEMWRGGKEGSFLSLLHVPVLGEGTQSTGSPNPPSLGRVLQDRLALGSSGSSFLLQTTLHFPLSTWHPHKPSPCVTRRMGSHNTKSTM